LSNNKIKLEPTQKSIPTTHNSQTTLPKINFGLEREKRVRVFKKKFVLSTNWVRWERGILTLEKNQHDSEGEGRTKFVKKNNMRGGGEEGSLVTEERHHSALVLIELKMNSYFDNHMYRRVLLFPKTKFMAQQS